MIGPIAARPDELPDKVWLPWAQHGPYLVRRQHLVAREPDGPCLCPVPIGQQLRGLAKATLEELRGALSAATFELARQLGAQLAEGRPYRLILRDALRSGRTPQAVEEALMALCRAGLVTVFFRNRRRSESRWEVRHVQLTNWGRAVLISIDAVAVSPVRSRPSSPGAGLAAPSAPGQRAGSTRRTAGEGNGDGSED